MYRCIPFLIDYYGDKYMRKNVMVLLILAILTVSVSASFAANPINNTTDLSGAINQAHAENKKVMIVFDQKSCMYCDMFKNDVLSNGDVISELNKNYILVFVDVNAHPNIADKYKVFGTPVIVFLDSNQKEIQRIDGYVDANEFLKVIKAI